ncbi:Tn3 family transposase post-transcriptional regulator TnpC [Zoogloea sp. LCSB751]|uniref:Tn3 family transposase post-transcriptional regulator TnpC n=1 Tax=Zoogloea sp. LCSB751 TaxID=1965277 RepID=UPI0009A5386F|nr:Tn3 family transposase post-transcriptional regulator TnpC [Zoogloea sp. LCSB751]
MKIPPPNFLTTPYGDVNAAKLDDLQLGYDTIELLRQVEHLEPIMRRLKRSNGIRDDILRLHRMAHTVINGAPLSEPYQEDLWEAAAALVEELQSVARACYDIAAVIQPLADLEPHVED